MLLILDAYSLSFSLLPVASDETFANPDEPWSLLLNASKVILEALVEVVVVVVVVVDEESLFLPLTSTSLGAGTTQDSPGIKLLLPGISSMNLVF